MKTSLSHDALVSAACRWLRSTQRCTPVYAEIVTVESETPDAIGWTTWECHVVECKTSRADMRSDAKKTHRRTGRGMGSFRWILAPHGLLRSEDVPDDHGWAETLTGKRIHIKRPAPRREASARDAAAEVRVLRSAVRRHRLGAEWQPSKYRFE